MSRHEPDEAGWPDPDAWYATRKEREAEGPDPTPPEPEEEPEESDEDAPGRPEDGPEPDYEAMAQAASDDAYDRYGRALEWGGEPGP